MKLAGFEQEFMDPIFANLTVLTGSLNSIMKLVFYRMGNRVMSSIWLKCSSKVFISEMLF